MITSSRTECNESLNREAFETWTSKMHFIWNQEKTKLWLNHHSSSSPCSRTVSYRPEMWTWDSDGPYPARQTTRSSAWSSSAPSTIDHQIAISCSDKMCFQVHFPENHSNNQRVTSSQSRIKHPGCESEECANKRLNFSGLFVVVAIAAASIVNAQFPSSNARTSSASSTSTVSATSPIFTNITLDDRTSGPLNATA